MTFQALLASKDDEAAAVLTPVLSGFGITALCCSYPDAICKLTEQKFDAVIVDFDDPHSGELVLQNVQQSSSGGHIVTVALLSDKASVRKVFGEGANFILYKPVTAEQAEAGLRAATALIKRERRIAYRVPVQVPVQLTVQDVQMEGILLDLSEGGMDILAAQPLCPGTSIEARFMLPDGESEIQVRGEIAWANPNGQAGTRFTGVSENVSTTLKSWIAAHSPELPPQDPEPVTQCKLTDLSLGGCYVQTESPFPERSAITLCLKADGMETQVNGTVRVMHPTFGMGIEFPSHTTEERGQVASFIGFLSSRPGTMPELLITPRAFTAAEQTENSISASGEELEDPLLDLLGRADSLSQEDFLQQLQQQRSSEVATA